MLIGPESMPTGNPKLLVKTPTSKNFSLGHAEYLEVFSGVKIGVDFTKVIHSFSCLFYPLCAVIDTGHKKENSFSMGCRGPCPLTSFQLGNSHGHYWFKTSGFFPLISLFAFRVHVRSSHPQQVSYTGSMQKT